MSRIIGRELEIRKLDRVTSSEKSEFVAIYGRRRIGKTFLVREYFNFTFDFQLTGLANANTGQQLTNFHSVLQQMVPGYENAIPDTWFRAFQYLIAHLEGVSDDRKKVVFLDELPWNQKSHVGD